MNFKIGDIVRVKPNVDWHPDYLNKRFIVVEKDSFVSYEHVFRLRPCGWERADDKFNIFFHVLVKEEDLKDLVLEDKMEPIRDIKKYVF